MRIPTSLSAFISLASSEILGRKWQSSGKSREWKSGVMEGADINQRVRAPAAGPSMQPVERWCSVGLHTVRNWRFNRFKKRGGCQRMAALYQCKWSASKNKILANEKLSVTQAAQAVGQSDRTDEWMDVRALSFLCLVERCWLPIRSTWNTADAAFIEFARAKIITSSIVSAFSARQSDHSMRRF